jgi:hypothetical protein
MRETKATSSRPRVTRYSRDLIVELKKITAALEKASAAADALAGAGVAAPWVTRHARNLAVHVAKADAARCAELARRRDEEEGHAVLEGSLTLDGVPPMSADACYLCGAPANMGLMSHHPEGVPSSLPTRWSAMCAVRARFQRMRSTYSRRSRKRRTACERRSLASEPKVKCGR